MNWIFVYVIRPSEILFVDVDLKPCVRPAWQSLLRSHLLDESVHKTTTFYVSHQHVVLSLVVFGRGDRLLPLKSDAFLVSRQDPTGIGSGAF